jgi:hypothetical protein
LEVRARARFAVSTSAPNTPWFPEYSNMKQILTFRIVALATVLAAGIATTTNLTAELIRVPISPFPPNGAKSPSQTEVDRANWAAGIAPFRTDLKSDFALVIATQALAGQAGYYKPDINQEAEVAAKRALMEGPHDSRIWLVLALLRNQANPRDPQLAELLKMSYFTGPNFVEVVPTRLQAVVTSGALSDPDLQELARGDVRLILTRRPDLSTSISDAYRRGSPADKRFLEDSVKTIDPKFAASLASGKQ